MTLLRLAIGLLGGGAVLGAALVPVSGQAASTGRATTPVRVMSGSAVPAGFDPVSVTFVSARRGWVLGAAPCPKPPCTAILRTVDGGRTWRAVAAPRAPLNVGGDEGGIHHLRFADARNGFAFGDQFYVTHDGARTWRQVRLPGLVGDVEAGGGWAYAAVSIGGGRVGFYRARVGSDRWSRLAGLPERPRSGAWFPDTGMLTVSGRSAWIVFGDDLYASPTGATWTRRRMPCATAWQYRLSAYSARRLTLLCIRDTAVGVSRKDVYASLDGGRTFARRGLGPASGHDAWVAQTTRSTVVIGAWWSSTFVHLSRDGGRSWRTGVRLDDSGIGIQDFSFVTARRGAMVVGPFGDVDRLYLTRDGGVHWAAARF